MPADDARHDDTPGTGGAGEPGSAAGVPETAEAPPADPWAGAEETEIRPDQAITDRTVPAGPTGTGVLPTVGSESPPRWAARAQVRPPELPVEPVDEEWVAPPRSPLVPVLVVVCVLLLVGLIGLGVFLVFNNRPTPAIPPVLPTAQSTAPAPTVTTARSSAAPTSPAPSSAATAVAIPDLRGLDYDTAANRLRALGFVPNRKDEISVQVPGGTVIRTDPAAGTTLLPGAKVDVYVAKVIVPTTAAPSITLPTTTSSQ